MATLVQHTGSTGWDTFTLTGVSEGNALFFVGTGIDNGAASVDSFSITGGITPDGQLLIQDVDGKLFFFAWWNSVSAGNYGVTTSTTNIGFGSPGGDARLLEVSGWTGTPTTVADSSFGNSTGTSHSAGSVTLPAAGIVLAGGVYSAGSVAAWTTLTESGEGSREILGHGIFGSGQAVSGAWTTSGSVTTQSAMVAIAEGAADTTAPTYDTVPAQDSVTATTITVDATATDAVDSTVDHFAIALTDAATAPASGTEAKSWYDTGTGSNNVVAIGTDASVANGVEGSITLTGLTQGTAYDIYYFVGDSSGNYNLHTKIDSTTADPPTFSVNPALDTQTHNSVTVTATAADASDATVDHYAVVVANNAPTPTAVQIAAGQDSTGAAAISAGSDLAVTNDVEGSITLTGLTVSTNYDVWYTVGDSGPTYAAPQKVDFKTRPLVSNTTIAADGVTVTIVFTENMSFGSGGSAGFVFATPTASLAYSSGEGTNTVTFTSSVTILSTDTPTLSYTQPTDGWEGAVSIIDLASFTGDSVNNNSEQSAGGTPTATAQEASDVPGGVITFSLTDFTNAPDGATLNGVAVSIANATTSSVDVTLPALATFVEGGTHETTEWQVDQTVQITDSASGDTAGDTIQIDPPEVSGPTYWFGTATTPSVDTVFPVAAEAGDEYFVEETSGTISNVSTAGSVEASTANYGVSVRIWDESAGAWSSITSESFDGTAPTLDTAVIPAAGTTVVLTFTEAVTQGAGYLDSDWTVNASGGATTLTYVSGDGTTEHTFAPGRTIQNGETVTLDWAGTGLEDAVGNDLATFSGQAVTNSSTADTAAPAFSSASIPEAGTSLTVVFTEAVTQGAGYADGDWTVNADSPVTLTYSSGDTTDTHIFTTSRTIGAGEVVTLDWAGTADGLEDSAGNDIAAFSGASVTNGSTADITAPVLTGASIPAAGTTVVLAFSEAITIGGGGNGGVTLTADGAVTATYSSGDTTSSLTYSTSRTIGSHEAVTVSYTQPGSGFEDAAGNEVASFSDEVVTNGSAQDLAPPTLVSASISGSQITLRFSEPVQVGAGGSGGFALTSDGGAVTMSNPSVDGTTITYDLSRTPETTETITLDYTQPTNGVEDLDGNDLATFADEAVSFGSILAHLNAALEHRDAAQKHLDASLTHLNAALKHFGG